MCCYVRVYSFRPKILYLEIDNEKRASRQLTHCLLLAKFNLLRMLLIDATVVAVPADCLLGVGCVLV